MLKVPSPRTRPEEVLLLLPLLPLAGAANTTTCNRPVVSSVACAGSTTVKLQLMLLGFIPPPLLVAAGRAVAPFWSVGHTTAAATVGPVAAAAAVGAGAVALWPLLLLLLLSARLGLGGPAGRPINAIRRSAPVCGVCCIDLGPVTAVADCVTAARSIGAAGRGLLLATACNSALINFRKPLLFETCCR